MHTEERPCEHTARDATYKPRREVSEETKPANSLTLDSDLQNCETINLCCLGGPVCGSYSSPNKLKQPERRKGPGDVRERSVTNRS